MRRGLATAELMANRFDPTRLEVFKNLFHSVAEEMGGALRRSAFSPNIKERRDYSCAVFDAAGEVLAMGDHMPVHLGSMPRSVEAAVRAIDLGPGDIAVLNDPYAGGTHLPDITMVMPVFFPFRARQSPSCLLRGESRAPCGYRRGAGGLDGTLARDFPGGPADSAGEDFRCRAARRRRAENVACERAHAARTRRRPDRADRLLPHRRTPAGGNRRRDTAARKWRATAAFCSSIRTR